MNKEKFYLILSTRFALELVARLIVEGHKETAIAVLSYMAQKRYAQDLFGSILLPNGAKFNRCTGSTKRGSYAISGYSHDGSDVEHWAAFGKKMYY